MEVLPTVIYLVLLILFSAIFSSSETALYSISPAKVQALQTQKIRGANLIAKLKDNPNKMLVVILIGNNLANVGSSAVATVFFSELFGSYGVGLATGIMTFALLIFGEILPKSFASKHSVKIAQFVVYPLLTIEYLFYPLVWVFEKALMKLTGDHIQTVSEEEVKAMVSLGANDGTLEKHEQEFIENVLEFNDILVEDVMTPRTKIFAASTDTKLKDLIVECMDERYSRIPIYEEDIDHIKGYVTVKMLLEFSVDTKNLEKTLGELDILEAFRIPKTKTVYGLFKEFKKKKQHMAIVYNEYGGVDGLITMEDILEEIVGDIADESDENETTIKKVSDNCYLIQPSTTVSEIEDLYEIEIPDYENQENISFIILDILKRFPKTNEEVQLYDLVFKITKMDGTKSQILELEVRKK